jgi:hypothetical protein
MPVARRLSSYFLKHPEHQLWPARDGERRHFAQIPSLVFGRPRFSI